MNYAKVLDNNPDIFLTELSLDVTLSNLVYTSYNKPSKDKMRLDFGLEKNRPHKYFKEMGGYHFEKEEPEPKRWFISNGCYRKNYPY